MLCGWCVFLCFCVVLLFSLKPPNTMERINQHGGQHRGIGTSIFHTASAQQSVSPSSLLPPSHTQKKKEGTFYYRNISGEGIIFITVLNKTKKSPPGKLQVLY